MQSSCSATLHHLIVPLHVRRYEDDLGSKPCPRVFEKFHSVWSSSSFLRVPEDHSLRFDVLVDQTRDCRSKRPLLIRTYPNEEPVWALDAGGQCCPDTGSRGNANTSLEHCGAMADAGYSMLVDDNDEDGCDGVPNFSSLVHTVFGGLATSSFVKSP